MDNIKKGQGAVGNINQRFVATQLVDYYDDLIWEEKEKSYVSLLPVYPKSIVNHTKGGRVPMFSLNPYQGCEHGCSYCYARPTHEFWSYNAGLDFERKILYKPNSVKLLEQYFNKKSYQAKAITLSGNTDCYQPIESKLQLTRQLLRTFAKYQHPVNIITKNALILRDLDILLALNQKKLVSVTFSINSLDEELRSKMEPRTSTIKKRLKSIQILTEHRIPVSVLLGPIIPGLNSHEILPILQKTAALGCTNAAMNIVRLNDSVAPVFTQWIQAHFPNRANKVLSQIKEIHQGELGNLKQKTNSQGSGKLVSSFEQTFRLGKKKYFPKAKTIQLNTRAFVPKNGVQLKLFD